MNVLPLFDLSHLPDPTWRVDPPAPTLLLAGWPDETAPTCESIAQRLADFIGGSIDVVMGESGEDQHWLMQVTIEGLPEPLILFAAPRSHDDGDKLFDGCGHVIGLESGLHAADPLTVYINLVRLLASAVESTPAILDVITSRVLDQGQLQSAYLSEGVEPPDTVLWVTEAVEVDAEAWLVHTRGLHRCGRAELGVGPLPVASHQPALMLLDGLASLSLEQPLPSAGSVLQIGLGLSVSLTTSADSILATHLDQPTALVHDPDATSAEDVLRALSQGDVALYRTTRAAARDARLSRETFDLFLQQCRSVDVDCLVQVPFLPPEESDADTHHLWLRVVEVIDDAVMAELLHTPAAAVGLSAGDRHKVDASMITNWCIMHPEGPLGPESSIVQSDGG